MTSDEEIQRHADRIAMVISPPLTDSEMQELLAARVKTAGMSLVAPEAKKYIRALDIALPWMVSEIRRLRALVGEVTDGSARQP